MYKILPFIILIYLLQSCSSATESKGSEIVGKIDKMRVADTIYELEVDSAGAVIDTISTIIYKKEELGKNVYEEIIADGFHQKNYYNNENDLRYRTTSFDGILFSVYDVVEKDNEIQYALDIEFKEGKPIDTIVLDYKYKYKKGKTTDLILSSVKDSIRSQVFVKFNEHEEPVSKVTIFDNTVIEEIAYKYEGKKFRNILVRNKKNSTTAVLEYNSNGYILSETITDNTTGSVIERILYKTNSKGDIIKKTIKSPDKIKYVVYKTKS